MLIYYIFLLLFLFNIIYKVKVLIFFLGCVCSSIAAATQCLIQYTVLYAVCYSCCILRYEVCVL
jgi:hypothetical protein